MNSGKKALAIIAAVAIAFVVIVGGTVAYLTRDVWSGDDTASETPYLHLSAGGELHTIEPVRWCDLFLDACDPALGTAQRPTPHVPVAIGDTVLLSVSADIAEAPWNLKAVYSTPKGLVEDESTKVSDTTYTLPLRSRADYVLIGITVAAASAVETAQGEVFPRGLFTVETTPSGYTVPAE